MGNSVCHQGGNKSSQSQETETDGVSEVPVVPCVAVQAGLFSEKTSVTPELLIAALDRLAALEGRVKSLESERPRAKDPEAVREETASEQWENDREAIGHGVAAAEAGQIVVEFKPLEAEQVITEGGKAVAEDARADGVLWGECELQGSIWDAAILIWSPHVGALGSAHSASMLVLNLCVQALYIMVVSQNMTDSKFNPGLVEALNVWRRTVAHDVGNMNGLTMKTLTHRICSFDRSLAISSDQRALYAQIGEYLPGSWVDPDRFESSAKFLPDAGPLMCILALIMWVASCAKEMHVVVAQVHAMMRVPVHRGLVMTELEDGTLRMDSMCSVRRSFYFVLIFVRMAFCWWLMINGVYYLIATVSLGDLLLNAVALEFVLNVDELLFEAFAPHTLKLTLERLQPLPFKIPSIGKGMDLHALVPVFVVFGVVGWGYMELHSSVELIEESRDALCKGGHDWVYTNSKLPPYLWWTDVEPVEDFARGKVLETLVNGPPYVNDPTVANRRLPDVAGSAWSITALAGATVSDAAGMWNDACMDMDASAVSPDVQEMMIQSLAMNVGDLTVSSCADALSHCGEDSLAGASSRMMCPETCSCHVPDGVRAMSSPGASGCPYHCRDHPVYLAALAQATCVDPPAEELIARADWIDLAQDFVQMSENWPPMSIGILQGLSQQMLASGCGVVGEMAGLFNICAEGQARMLPSKSIRFYCPVACNCTAGDLNCPTTC